MVPEKPMPKQILPSNNQKRRSAPARKGKNGAKKQGKGRALGPRPPRTRGNEVIERGIPGFRALRYKATLNYYDSFSLNSGTGTVGNYVYSANGLYDPDITGTGHQPMAFDQLMLSFDHYCVTRSRITVNFRNQHATYIISAGISLNGSSAPVTSYVALVENGEMVRVRLNGQGLADCMATLVLPISIAKFGSVTDLLDNPEYHGTIAANPTEQSYFNISVWNTFDSAVVSIIAEVFIEYEAWFFEPRKNSVSINQQLSRLILSEMKTGK